MLHTRGSRFGLAALAVMGLAVPHAARAQVLYSDNFNSANGGDINAGVNDPGRQQGTLAPGAYDTTSGGTNSSATVGSDAILSGALSMTPTTTTTGIYNSVATLNPLFTLSTNTLTISADLVNPFAGNGGSWQAFVFSPTKGNFVNAGTQTFGLLFAPNGTYQAFSNGTVFSGGTNTTTNTFTGGNVTPTGTYHVDISIAQLASGNTFGVNVNGTPLFTTFTRTTDVISSGYLELIGRTKGLQTGSATALQTFTFDNLAVTAAPEPSQTAALGLGLLGLAGLAFKARKRSSVTV